MRGCWKGGRTWRAELGLFLGRRDTDFQLVPLHADGLLATRKITHQEDSGAVPTPAQSRSRGAKNPGHPGTNPYLTSLEPQRGYCSQGQHSSLGIQLDSQWHGLSIAERSFPADEGVGYGKV